MSLTDLSVVVSQIALPVGLLIWLARWPARDTLSYIVRTGTTALYLVALCLVPIWLVLPWWTPWVYFVAAMALVAGQAFRGRIPVRHRLPRTRFGWIGTLVFSLYAIALAAVCFHAISGRAVPDDVVDLAFPMGTGTYLVASGGSTRTVNGHLATLDPQTDRQRAYRGQSYAVDLIKLNDLGLHALGWRPEDPSAYAIFGEPVLRPLCRKSACGARWQSGYAGTQAGHVAPGRQSRFSRLR